MKCMHSWAATAAIVASFGLTPVAMAAPAGLAVRVTPMTPVLKGDVDVQVTVSVTNTTREALSVLRWDLPSASHDNALFSIERDGVPVAYTGKLVKRGAPTADDYVLMQPGQTLDVQVELSSAYDLSRSGTYTVAFASSGARDGVSLRSEPAYMWLEARTALAQLTRSPAAAAAGQRATPIFTGCSASRQTDLTTATANALVYANAALAYQNSARAATQRFTRWFGPGSRSSWGTIRTNFTKISDAFATQTIEYDCSTCPAGPNASAYAYVFRNQPYKIYLCNAFWAAPALGTDSKAGTLIHEMSHFTVVANTDDNAYGQSACVNLALNNPALALRNADSHEYFAENTPALP